MNKIAEEIKAGLAHFFILKLVLKIIVKRSKKTDITKYEILYKVLKISKIGLLTGPDLNLLYNFVYICYYN